MATSKDDKERRRNNSMYIDKRTFFGEDLESFASMSKSFAMHSAGA